MACMPSPQFNQFREGRCTTDQVTLLTDDIEAGFERNDKCGAVFIDLSAAYDTVWHRGLKLKLNNVIPDKSLVNFIMTLIASRSFIMHVGADRSKQRFLENGVPQGSVLAPLLFNLYTSDLPKTQSKKYIYADDIALMISGKTFGPIEQSLSEDLDTMSRYFNNWRLKINTGKTVCTSFHLAHRLAKYQLQVTCEGQNIPHEDNPKYLGVTLDRTLTFKAHVSKLSQKISARNNLLRRLAGLSWGANFKVLQTAAVCLVYAPAEYCAPAWSSSTHTAKIDIVLNTTMRIVSGCLKTTPTFYLPVVSGIIPPDIRRSNISLKLFNKADSDPAHLLHNACTRGSPIKPRLTSRTPFSKQCVSVNSSEFTDNPSTWPMNTWNSRWANLSTPLHRYISSPSTNPIGHGLWPLWTTNVQNGPSNRPFVQLWVCCTNGPSRNLRLPHHKVPRRPHYLRPSSKRLAPHYSAQLMTRRPRHTINQNSTMPGKCCAPRPILPKSGIGLPVCGYPNGSSQSASFLLLLPFPLSLLSFASA